MNDKQAQRTSEEIRHHNRTHRDGSGVTAAFALGGAGVVVVLGLLWWLT